MNLTGRHVLITGASSGIGRELASVLASRGARLALAARRIERLRQVSDEIALGHPGVERPLAVECDVTDGAAVRHLVGATIETLGALDVLINNAGVCVYGETARTPLEDFERLLDVNFLGPVRAMFEALPFMRRQGQGLIVNVASLAAVRGVPYLGAYGASKSALATLSESLRAELAGTGVRVMVVYPDYTESDIYASEKKVGGARRPDGPYAPTRDVAEAIVRAIEADRRDLMLSSRGRLMAALDGVLPGAVERAMVRLAKELREEDEPS